MYGKKIRSLRVLRGFSQEDVCRELGMDSSKYSRIETDIQKPTAEMLEQIARILGVTLPDIMSGEPIVIQNLSSEHGESERKKKYYEEKIDLYERIIASQKEEISRLIKNEDKLLALLAKKK